MKKMSITSGQMGKYFIIAAKLLVLSVETMFKLGTFE